ncbi:hypothetical protein M501DRAFT_1055112 [Patellaria atrata CBS 101060]|uniref:26S proteasome complex subunit SEM1 n=1 Tax=Patellaria atrata CBS 101060 TaxID=1346257 RepID=A0A9P4SH52_9PEZI|nr:hypothetical protein M501DRAFT_1055112 [Patellaria atrata CBS 101060]
MSGSVQASSTTAKATVNDTKDNGETPKEQQKPATQLEEDDEFEDFPVEGAPQQEETELPSGSTHLWEESWDDDDTNDEFSQQLREEIKRSAKSS